MFEDERMKLRKFAQRREDKTEKVLSKQERDNYIMEAVIKNYEDYKLGKRGVYITTSFDYDYLKKYGFIDLTPEQQQRIQRVAKQELNEYKIQNKKRGQTIVQALAEITAGDIIAESKRKAVAELYENSIFMERNLPEEIRKEVGKCL